MDFEGTWWLLIEEAGFNEQNTPQLTMGAGEVLDGRTDQRLGAYSLAEDEITIQLGGSKIVAHVRPGATSISGNLFSGKGRREMVLPITLFPLAWRPPSEEEIAREVAAVLSRLGA
ncbi:hypothetical protein [Sphingomonas sp.]|uniref:hypothetical protein n=1 Tax=Sphingomonas sp. TaxID=28214 RepID=UPI0028A776AC|nr:hypothetical protein [Sphingomonas sp.]